MASNVKETLGELNRDTFVPLLSKLIGESEHLQNNPPGELIPKEKKVVDHLLDHLRHVSTVVGTGDGKGPLLIEHVSYDPERGNLIVKYPGTEDGKVVSFVGAHMDVVPADPSQWTFEPFKLTFDPKNDDILRGRGTTDCLGHVALLAELMKKLGETKPKLKTTVVAVFIASEEFAADPSVGVERLHEEHKLDELKNGPLYWVDTANSQPCVGTASMIPWTLHVKGKLFHSGLPSKGINAMELAMEALKEIQTKFYKDYPPHSEEKVYEFSEPSTMKPTWWSYPGGGLNQIPGDCTIKGDVRLTPFYSVETCKKNLEEYVKDINDHLEDLPKRGPVSKYVLPEENLRGSVAITFGTSNLGVACKLDSLGYNLLYKATEEVIGYAKRFSISGSLPLIKQLPDEGFDVQTVGYGLSATYHANDEYCRFSDMNNGYKVFASIISKLENNEY